MSIEKNSYLNNEAQFPWKMYQVPGHGEVQIDKYLRDKTQDEAIQALAENPNKDITSFTEIIKHTQETERISLIREALNNEDITIQKSATNMIWYIPETERTSLIRKALNDKNLDIQKAAADMIRHAPETERTSLIREALNDKDFTVQKAAADMIRHAPETEQAPLRILIAEKVREELNDKNPTIRKSAANMIMYTPETEQSLLIRKALNDEDPVIQKTAANIIKYIPEAEQIPLRILIAEKIRKALNNEDSIIRKLTASIIRYAPETERALLIRKALNDKNSTVQEVAANMIGHAPETEQAPLKILIAENIREALNDKDPTVQKSAINMIKYAQETERASLIREAADKGLGNEIIKPPLYNKYPEINTKKFQRKEFEKTDSETTLIGGALKDKIIIRHIAPKSFIAWQKIYENWQVWKEKGFDYIPIEPIQSYQLNKITGLVDVYTGVLDLSLASWKRLSHEMFGDALNSQKKLIEEVLNNQSIQHGHKHEDNFVLRFFRDKNGNPDFTKTPRLYLIDFDMAIILKKKLQTAC